MKSKDLKDLHQQQLPELTKRLSQAQADVAKLKLDLSTAKLKDVKSLSRTRLLIAVLKTIISAK